MDKSGDPGLFGRWFRGLSLRAWLIVGFMMALLPVAALSAFWYLDYRDQLREPFRQVLHTQHKVSLALERIQGNLWDIATDVNDFAQTGDESYRDRFETAERDIAANLRDLEMITETYPSFDPVLEGVRQQWTLLLEAASNVSPLPGGAEVPKLRYLSQGT